MIRKYDAQKMCDEKLKEYNLTHWKASFISSTTKCAACDFENKRILISTNYCNACTIEDMKETILHEIAHALVGYASGHNEVWQAKAKEIGLNSPQTHRHVNMEAGNQLSFTVEGDKKERKFNRLDKICPKCGEKAIETNSAVMNEVRWAKLKCGHLVKYEQIKSSSPDYSNWTSRSGKVIFPFQSKGIEFLEQANGRALIADEPGLGKTITALGFIFHHAKEVCPVLWICKTTLKLQALKEAIDWCGDEFMGQIIENPRSMIIPNLKLYIISMDLLRNMPSEKMEKIGFRTIVADEIQHFKNPQSTRTSELRKLVGESEYFIPLSGTPWKNRGQEYFPVLNMLDASRFSSYANFKNRWVDYYLDERTGKIKQGGIRNIPAFKEYTKDMVIRRMRDDVLPDLPKINRQIRYIDMEDMFKKAYDKAELHVANRIKAAIIDGKDAANMQGEIMQLKHITGLAKCEVAIEDTIEFLEDTEEHEKITIFHHHIDVGDNIQSGDAARTYTGLDNYLEKNNLKSTLRLYGGRNPDERNRIIEDFKNDPKRRVLIASTLASGEGLNIQFCQNAMMVERQWNPMNEEQAELRFSRPLSKSDLPEYLWNLVDKKVSIRVPYLIADQTVDSMLTEIVERKRAQFRRVMNPGEENVKWEESDIVRELSDMIIKKRFGK